MCLLWVLKTLARRNLKITPKRTVEWFFQYVRKIFRKTNITLWYARIVSFSENFAHVLNEWSPLLFAGCRFSQYHSFPLFHCFPEMYSEPSFRKTLRLRCLVGFWIRLYFLHCLLQITGKHQSEEGRGDEMGESSLIRESFPFQSHHDPYRLFRYIVPSDCSGCDLPSLVERHNVIAGMFMVRRAVSLGTLKKNRICSYFVKNKH